MGDLVNKLSAPNTPGSGWAQALNSGGYLAPAYHFYPKGEVRSVCQTQLRRYRPPTGSIPDSARKCKGCQDWVDGHPDGGVRYSRVRKPR